MQGWILSSRDSTILLGTMQPNYKAQSEKKLFRIRGVAHRRGAVLVPGVTANVIRSTEYTPLRGHA